MVQTRIAPPAGETLECDVCVIGGGAAGFTVALGLMGGSEKVLLVDPGPADGRQGEQDLYEGTVSNPAHAQPHLYRHRRLGGSTAVWGGRCIPYDPIDFAARDYVRLSGWPIGRDDLKPHYEEAQRLMEAGAFDYDGASAIAGGAFIAGFDDPDVLTRSLERFSLPTNFWREYKRVIEQSANVQVVSLSTAVRLEQTGSGVSQLTCVGPQGEFTVRARAFVVAVGGLETVRLLGHSRVCAPDGMLGRAYMCHIDAAIGKLHPNPKTRAVEYGFQRTRDGVYSRRRFTLSEARQRELRIMNAAVRPHHPPVGDPVHGNAVYSAMFLAKRFIIHEYAARFSAPEDRRSHTALVAAHLFNVIKGAPALAAFTVDWTHRRYLSRRRIPYVSLPSTTFALEYNGEQEPNLDSRVTLGGDLDRNGVPKLNIDWRMTELDVATAAATLREIRAALRRTGCGDVEFEDAELEAQVRDLARPVGGHHIGTARMSDTPAGGVVDSDCRVHGVDNLYVAGSATFPTSSHANPTLTIVALAHRLAGHLRGRLAERDLAA